VQVIARHEMREKEQLRKRVAKSQAPNALYDKMFEGAPDPVTITVELFCARGLSSRDGKCEAYPKVGLRWLKEDKVVRKRVGPPGTVRTVDPVWNAKFQFVISAARMGELVLQVSVFHADKFGRDAFLGVVHLPLEDISGQNMQDWFPFKQRKPTDKVSGELHMRVVNSAHGGALQSPERTVELYSAQRNAQRSAHNASQVNLLELTARCSIEELQKMYRPEEPNSPDVIVCDQIQKSLVLAVSREKYIALLTTQARMQKDPEFLVDALLTIETWTTPEVFLAHVMARYVGPPKASPEWAEFEPTMRAVQGGVVKVLFEWINNPLMAQDFFKTFGLKEMLLQFGHEQGLSLRALNMAAKQSTVDRRMRSNSLLDVTSTNTRSRREESVFELPPLNVAEQLTLIEYSLLSEIRLGELCGQAWNKDGKEERAPNVLRYISWFNRVSRWVVTQIITQGEAVERAVAITKFVELGVALSGLNNFNGVIEILSALHSSAISRLKETWALVLKETIAKLEELDQLMNTEGNFRHYRMLLDKSKPPVVPYMGLLLTDLTFMDDANLTELGKGDKGHKLLNLEKIRMLAGVYRLFRKCISKPYSYPEIRSIRRLLEHIEGFDDNELYRLSKLRESAGSGAVVSANAFGPSDKKQRRLISQITSTMLVRNKLDVADDCMAAKDWEQLLALESVTLQVRHQGDVLFEAGQPNTHLVVLKSGSVAQLYQGEVVSTTAAAAGSRELFGVLSVLDASRCNPFATVVASENCEMYLVPAQTVHIFTADLDMSRKFYGSVAHNQVQLLLGLNLTTLSTPKKASVTADLVERGAWDVSWSGTSEREQKEYEYAGVLVLYDSCATLSSKMLGFLKREMIPLSRVQSCSVQGNAGCVLYTGKRGEEVRRSFRCLSGFGETELVVARINAAAAAAKIEAAQEDRSALSESLEEEVVLQRDPMALQPQDWAALTQGAKRVVVKAGEAVMKEGESYQRMYQIVRGVIRVEKKIGEEVKLLGTLRASETFGELSFLAGSAATATCRADSEEVELTIMEGYYLNMLFQIRPEIAGRFYKFLSMLITARILGKVQ
jgi:CRP-like cAMP-binding protein